jgi:hypothetical protein
MKRLAILILVAALAAGYYRYFGAPAPAALPAPVPASAASDVALSDAFRRQQSHVQVGGEGQVVRILSDDVNVPRHQRFILKLSSGQTLLVAHNIDLAPRIGELKLGDAVAFYGEYEWNDKGGVIHWTHRDPAAKHVAGWLKCGGRVYQ